MHQVDRIDRAQRAADLDEIADANGRNSASSTPPGQVAQRACSDRPIASPPAPSAATSGADGSPSTCSAVTTSSAISAVQQVAQEARRVTSELGTAKGALGDIGEPARHPDAHQHHHQRTDQAQAELDWPGRRSGEVLLREGSTASAVARLPKACCMT
jgi:hypothetical protein